jgi:hypothetical protein
MSKPICCSFCGKSQHEVRKMISGPSVHVCDECVDLLYEIVHGRAAEGAKVVDKDHLGKIGVGGSSVIWCGGLCDLYSLCDLSLCGFSFLREFVVGARRSLAGGAWWWAIWRLTK